MNRTQNGTCLELILPALEIVGAKAGPSSCPFNSCQLSRIKLFQLSTVSDAGVVAICRSFIDDETCHIMRSPPLISSDVPVM
jgi:hypothetical protein